MAIESFQDNRLRVKDLAVQANNSLEALRLETPPLRDAVSRLEFVSRLMTSEAVSAYAEMVGLRVRLISDGVFTNGLEVTNEGFIKLIRKGRESVDREKISPLCVSRDAMLALNRTDPFLVRRIAKLREEKIIEKFQKVITDRAGQPVIIC